MKKKKQSKKGPSPLVQAKKYALIAAHILNKHSVVIIFIIAGGTIGFSLVRARSYLNPIRDEDRYSESTGKNKYSKIDYTLVDKLQKSLNDIDVQVSQSLSPNRKNPFSE